MKRVYFAGKVSSNGWRQSVLNLRDEVHKLGSTDELINNYEEATAPGIKTEHGFIYGGPFLLSCDHSCYHGKTSHGMGASDGYRYGACGEANISRESVFNWCMISIKQSDVVFCYLEDTTAYGTLFELGCAYLQNKAIYIYLAPTLKKKDLNELWFPLEAARVVKKVDKIDEAIKDFKDRLLRDETSNQNKTVKTGMDDLATQPQIDFIRGLLAKKGLVFNELIPLSKKNASQFIDLLKNQEDFTIFRKYIKQLKPSSIIKTKKGKIGVIMDFSENFKYSVRLESGEEVVLSNEELEPFHPTNRKEHSIAYKVITESNYFSDYNQWVEMFNDVQYDKNQYMEFNSIKGFPVSTIVKTNKGIANLKNPGRKYRKCWGFEDLTMYTIKAEDSYFEDQMLRFVTTTGDSRVFYIGTNMSSMQKIKELEKKTICSTTSMNNFNKVITLKHVEGWNEVKDIAESFSATREELRPVRNLMNQHNIPLTINQHHYLKSLYVTTLQILITLNGSFVDNNKNYDFSSISGKTSKELHQCLNDLKEFNSVCRRFKIMTTPIDFDSSEWFFKLSPKGVETIFKQSNLSRIERISEVFPDLLQFDLERIKQKYRVGI